MSAVLVLGGLMFHEPTRAAILNQVVTDNENNGYVVQNGKSAYELAVENGFEGTVEEWLASLQGIHGNDGTNGIDGKDGENGVDGMNGTNGQNGLNGQNGKDGVDGTNGKDGENGKDGTDGLNGTDGQDGQNGTDGQNGKSAYDLAVENGFDGTLQEWLESLRCQCSCCVVPEPIFYFSGDEMIAVHELAGISYFQEIIVPIITDADEITLSKDPDLNDTISFLIENSVAMFSTSEIFGFMFDYCQHNADNNTDLYLSITNESLRIINGVTFEVVIEIENDFFPLDSEFYIVRTQVGTIGHGGTV